MSVNPCGQPIRLWHQHATRRPMPACSQAQQQSAISTGYRSLSSTASSMQHHAHAACSLTHPHALRPKPLQAPACVHTLASLPSNPLCQTPSANPTGSGPPTGPPLHFGNGSQPTAWPSNCKTTTVAVKVSPNRATRRHGFCRRDASVYPHPLPQAPAPNMVYARQDSGCKGKTQLRMLTRGPRLAVCVRCCASVNGGNRQTPGTR